MKKTTQKSIRHKEFIIEKIKRSPAILMWHIFLHVREKRLKGIPEEYTKMLAKGRVDEVLKRILEESK